MDLREGYVLYEAAAHASGTGCSDSLYVDCVVNASASASGPREIYVTASGVRGVLSDGGNIFYNCQLSGKASGMGISSDCRGYGIYYTTLASILIDCKLEGSATGSGGGDKNSSTSNSGFGVYNCYNMILKNCTGIGVASSATTPIYDIRGCGFAYNTNSVFENCSTSGYICESSSTYGCDNFQCDI